jgi:hypothetical protein
MAKAQSIKAFLAEWRGAGVRAQVVVLDEIGTLAQSYASRASAPPRTDLPPPLADAHQTRRDVYQSTAARLSSLRALLAREAAK